MKSFKASNVPEVEHSARYLLCEAAGINYTWSAFQSSLDMTLSDHQVKRMESHCTRRIAREPIQYIIGNWDFRGRVFQCASPVLIPRPETEEMVDLIISSEILRDIKRPSILDIGSGSGVIGVSLLAEIPSSNCVAIDPHPSAVSLSHKNASTILCSTCSYSQCPEGIQCCRYTTLQCDIQTMCSSSSTEYQQYIGSFDLLVSNPPYIPSTDIPDLEPEVRIHESELALDGGPDGLDIIRSIVQLSPSLLSSSGTKELWMEVSPTHPQAIEESLELLPDCRYTFVEGIKDMYGRPRFVRLKLK
eukprot:CAMPEP_0185037392 /NCGR_PEP_ID=MMETSP1103-20130426/31726_1 /TAXON_ID=36769 /ORGANISM="Paraphysomonas bandaiensis, Strain Caron Lab Isolate" /LENGTH=302 /DNA_ID=CAMNT_0027575345 /DNA_START=142 /DNA_END=1050 /DNA_ORIENTATION=-